MENILDIKNLRKTYKPSLFSKKRIKALDDVSLHVKKGEIFGLIGPNGAGKSTVIKILMGLARPDRKNGGEAYIKGLDVVKNGVQAREHIGGIIETPELDKNLTARDNLRYLARLEGNVTKAMVEDAIEFTKLSDRIDEKFKNYSLGMKQRIGLAQAMMGNHSLLILDEPTNGMDPNWIINTRDMLLKLAHERNVSIIICSHILPELELLCDRIAVIVNGKIWIEKTKEELHGQVEDNSYRYLLETDNVKKSKEVLKANNIEHEEFSDHLLFVTKKDNQSSIIKKLVDADINVFSCNLHKETLEEIFNQAISLAGGVR